LRVAVVGAGWWGQQHLRAFSAQRNVELVGVCGRSFEKTVKRAARWNVAPYTDLDGMLAETRPDLVSLCLPNQGHFEPTLTAIRAGVAVLAEKPLVFDPAEADQLIAEAEAQGLFFAVCFNHRYARAVQMAKAALGDGRLGDLVLATWRFGGEGGTDHPYNNLIETQCHGFDMLEHFAGPATSVSAHFSERRSPGAFTTMAVSLGFGGGAVGSLVGSYDASYAHAGVHALELVGTKGRILVEDTVRRFTFSPHGAETSEVWEAGYFNDRDRQFYLTLDAYLADMLAALRTGSPPPVPAEAGRRALQLAHACIRSAQTGARVALSPPTPPAAPDPR
jgi:predicted dehydrogenase